MSQVICYTAADNHFKFSRWRHTASRPSVYYMLMTRVYYMLMTRDARRAVYTIVTAMKLQRGREAARPRHEPYFSDFNCTLA